MPKKPNQTKARKRTLLAIKRKRDLNKMLKDEKIKKDTYLALLKRPLLQASLQIKYIKGKIYGKSNKVSTKEETVPTEK